MLAKKSWSILMFLILAGSVACMGRRQAQLNTSYYWYGLDIQDEAAGKPAGLVGTTWNESWCKRFTHLKKRYSAETAAKIISFVKVNRAQYGLPSLIDRDYTVFNEACTTLQQNKDNPSLVEVDTLYAFDPVRAALQVYFTYGAKDQIPYGYLEHQQLLRTLIPEPGEKLIPENISQTRKALSDVAKYKLWWTDLIVAKFLEVYPEMRSDELVAAVKGSDNALVQEVLTRLKKPKSL